MDLSNTQPSFLFVQGNTDYFFFFWGVMKGLYKALISFSKWKIKQDKKNRDDVVEMPWAFDAEFCSAVLPQSCDCQWLGGFLSGVCQVSWILFLIFPEQPWGLSSSIRRGSEVLPLEVARFSHMHCCNHWQIQSHLFSLLSRVHPVASVCQSHPWTNEILRVNANPCRSSWWAQTETLSPQ